MTSIEYGHINKFVASVGVGLMLGSAVVPWAVMQLQEPLAQSRGDLRSYTSTARDVLTERQDLLLVLQRGLPWISAVMLVLGFALVVGALVRWSQRQKVADAREDAEAAAAALAVNEMSPDDVHDRQGSEATESQQDGRPPGDTPSAREQDANTTQLVALEDMVAEITKDAYLQSHQLLKNVRVGADRTAVDALALAQRGTGWTSFVVETMVARTRNVDLRKKLRDVARASAELTPGPLATRRRGRPPLAAANAVIVLIMQDTTALEAAQRDVLPTVRKFNAQSSVQVGVILTTKEKLELLGTEEWRIVVNDVLKEPSQLRTA